MIILFNYITKFNVFETDYLIDFVYLILREVFFFRVSCFIEIVILGTGFCMEGNIWL